MTSLPVPRDDDRREMPVLRIQPALAELDEFDDADPLTVPEKPAQTSAPVNESVPASPVVNEPAAKTVAAKKPAAKTATAKKPAAKSTTAKKPAAKTTTAKKPAAKTTEAATKEPAAKSTAAKPAAKTATAKKPAAKKASAKSTGATKAAPKRPAPKKPEPAPAPLAPIVVSVTGLMKNFGATRAVDGVDLVVREGSFYGILGPNGAGKTTTLSMITGMLRPDAGTITVHDIDVWAQPALAKRTMGILPDQLRLFDRLTGAQLLHYAGSLRGLSTDLIRVRAADLVNAFGLQDAMNRLVSDYSAGMTKKIALAAAMIHAPRLLVLDEPFESVDPVSASNVVAILKKFVSKGGTVLLSSHGMELVERVCDHVAIMVDGKVLASGTRESVQAGRSLRERFIELAESQSAVEEPEWLHSFSD